VRAWRVVLSECRRRSDDGPHKRWKFESVPSQSAGPGEASRWQWRFQVQARAGRSRGGRNSRSGQSGSPLALSQSQSQRVGAEQWNQEPGPRQTDAVDDGTDWMQDADETGRDCRNRKSKDARMHKREGQKQRGSRSKSRSKRGARKERLAASWVSHNVELLGRNSWQPSCSMRPVPSPQFAHRGPGQE